MSFSELLKKLPFSKLDNDVLNHLLINEFSDYNNTWNFHFDNDLIISQIKNTNIALRDHLKNCESSINWRQLIEQDNIDVNKCLGFIFCIVNYAKLKERINLLVESSSLYLLLITLPLSQITNVFHPNLYIQSIETLLYYSAKQNLDHIFSKHKQSLVDYCHDLKMAIKCLDRKDFYSVDNTMRCLIMTVLNLKGASSELADYMYNCVCSLLVYYKEDEAFLSIIKYATPFLSMSEARHLNLNEQTINLKFLTQFIVKIMKKYGNQIVNTFLQLIKSMTITSAEKSAPIDLRRKRMMVIAQFVKSLNFTDYDEYMQWFANFTCSTKKQHRVFAQQIILQLLPTENIVPNSDDSHLKKINEMKDNIQSYKTIFRIIIDRCYDTNDEVATRAIQNIAEAFNIQHMNDLLIHIFSKDTSSTTSIDITGLPTADSINKLILHYLREDKISLRKAALQLLECIAIKKPKECLNASLKEQLVVMIRDFSVSVRTQALNILTELVLKYMAEDKELLHIWLENVLPEASNTISGLDNKIYLDLAKLFLENLVPFHDISIRTNCEIPWIILGHIQKKHWRQYLEDAIMYWNSKKMLSSNIKTTILTYINTKYNLYALLLLSCMSKIIQFTDVSFAIKYYDQYMGLSNGDKEIITQIWAMRFVLEILSSKHKMSTEARYKLADNIIHHITTWNVPVNLAVNFIDTVTCLQNSADWKEHYAEIACDTIKESLSAFQDAVPFNVEQFEIALLLYAENSKGIRKMPFQQLAVRLCHKICSNEQTVTVLFRQKSSLYRTMLLTLGRLCLREEVAATSAIPIYIKIMLGSSKTEEKILCLIILKDLCTMYTRLIEPHMDVLLLCFRCEYRVRAVAARLITELLADGFVKLNGEQMVCYLSMALDRQKDVKCVVDYYISQKLLTAQDRDFLHDMLLGVIYFHNNKVSSSALGKGFSLHGDEMSLTRHNLYHYMVFNMREKSRLKAVHTLYANILGPWSSAFDENSNEPEELSIVCDVLRILSLRQMKPEFLITDEKKNEIEQDDMRMETDQEEDGADDKKKLALIEMMSPILLNFKVKLQTPFDSPKKELLKELFHKYIHELSIDYRREIKKANPQFSKPLFGK